MGQARIVAKIERRYSAEEAAKRIDEYRRKVRKNLLRQAIYLQVIHENKLKRKLAYQNRAEVKAGTRESYRQRKRRLNKERRLAMKSK